MKSLLEKLNLTAVNPGTCFGPDNWLQTANSPITSYNPTTGEAIAQFIPTTPDAYNHVGHQSQAAFQTCRAMPAPTSGLVMRDLVVAMRARQDSLGAIVSPERDKIYGRGIA